MTKDIRNYKEKLDEILKENDQSTDWEAVSAELLVKIGFYQHERLVHLIVSMSVGIMCIVSVLATFFVEIVSLSLLILVCLFVVLVVPYIIYYYMLENAVQDIYRYYDRVREKCGDRRG